MKNLFFLILMVFSFSVFAQKPTIDTKVTYNDGRVEMIKAGVFTNLFDSKFLDPRIFTDKKIITYSADNKKIKIPTSDIQKVDFTDLRGNERHFAKMPEYDRLVEVLYDGKAKWYRLYGSNLYDGSLTAQDYLYANNKSYFFSILKNNKTKLKEFFSSRKDLFPLIDKLNYNKLNNDDLIEVLKKFDEQ